MIPAVLAPAAALFARLGPAIARLEARHWVAVAGSAALHLGVLLGLDQAPPPVPPPMTFEVKLEPPPAAKPPKQRLVESKPKPREVKAKQRLAKKKPVKKQAREPDTLLTEWKRETRPAKNVPAVTLPDARALGVNLASEVGRAAPAKLASASPRPGASAPTAPASSSAASALSEPGGKTGSGQGASGGAESGIALVAAQGLGKSQVIAAGGGAQGSDALAGSAAASGQLAVASLAASAQAGSLDRAAGGGGHVSPAADMASHSPGAVAGGEPQGVRLTMAGALSSLPAVVSGNGSLAAGQQLDAGAGLGAASAGQGSPANLAAAGAGARPTPLAGVGTPQVAGGGGETSAREGRGEAAHGGDAVTRLAMAAPAPASAPQPTRAGQGGDSVGATPASGDMSGASTAPRAPQTALAQSGRGDSAGKAPAPRKGRPGHGEAGGKSATAAPGATAAAGKLAASQGVATTAAAPDPMATKRAAGSEGSRGGVITAASSEPPSSASGGARGLATGSAGSGRLGGGTTQGTALSALSGGGMGFSGTTAPAALAPGEPGSAPGLAVAMPVVPVVLEMRGGGSRSDFRGAAGAGSGGGARAATPALARAESGQGEALPGRGSGSPGIAAAPQQVSAGAGGASPVGTGNLQGVKMVAVQQIRADSQVQPLDVLAPSTYCPLPGHAQPDNRPRDTTQLASETPTYANENPSFSFPIRAWAYGHQGRAIVRVQVLADGSPGQMWLKQSSGSGILDVDAREQLANYRFKPARKNGQPVTAWIDVPVDYRLNAEK